MATDAILLTALYLGGLAFSVYVFRCGWKAMGTYYGDSLVGSGALLVLVAGLSIFPVLNWLAAGGVLLIVRHAKKRAERRQECFPLLDPNIPESGSRYPDKGCYRPGCTIHGRKPYVSS